MPCESHGCHKTLEGGTVGRVRLDAPDGESHVTLYGDNTGLTSPMAYSTSFSKTPLAYNGEETCHPPDTDFNEVLIVGLPDSRECTTATEALQITQQGVHSSNQHTSQGKPKRPRTREPPRTPRLPSPVANPASDIKNQTRLLPITSKQKGEVSDPFLAGHHDTICYYTPGDVICSARPPARPSPEPPPSLDL